MSRAAVIGAGPNGLAAAITVAAAGVETTVFERNAWVGGACSTAEVTLPGFRHDLGASVFPMGVASPFLRGLGLSATASATADSSASLRNDKQEERNDKNKAMELPWIQPDAPCAHPLDDGTAVMLERGVGATADGLDAADRERYIRTFGYLAEGFEELVEDLLGPVVHVPRHPWLMARFGMGAILPAAVEARRYEGPRARALFAGILVSYAQGMALLSVASKYYGYGLNLGAVARIWRGGCIIRSALLDNIAEAYATNPELGNILLAPNLSQQLADHLEGLRQTICQAAAAGVPVPGLMVSLGYFDAYRSAWLPDNLIQAQRDYFGAHTYERIEGPGSFHTDWEKTAVEMAPIEKVTTV